VCFLVGVSKLLLETVTNTNTGNWSNQKHKLHNQQADKARQFSSENTFKPLALCWSEQGQNTYILVY
jgi:hypothetical protein